ncbi:MAG TPA: hypothetical protein VF950_21360 [Planctomycetota bacterium]
MTSSAAPEDRSPITASVVLLLIDILGYAAFAIHTVLSRRRYGRYFAEHLYDAPLPARLLVETPAPLYAAAFLLFALAMLVKEVGIERKEVALRVNVAALALLGALWMTWVVTVTGPCDALERDLAP